jgi:hypothetical protein
MGKIVNHDDTIPEAQLKKHVERTGQAWEELVRTRNEAYVESQKLNEKLKRVFVPRSNRNVYIDGRLCNNEEKAFQGSYNSGSYESSPEYDPTHHHKKNKNKVIEPNSEDEYDDEKTSFHDKSKFIVYD